MDPDDRPTSSEQDPERHSMSRISSLEPLRAAAPWAAGAAMLAALVACWQAGAMGGVAVFSGLLLAGAFIIDRFTAAGMVDMGPRVALLIGIPALTLAAVVLIWVHPRRDPRDAEAMDDVTAT